MRIGKGIEEVANGNDLVMQSADVLAFVLVGLKGGSCQSSNVPLVEPQGFYMRLPQIWQRDAFKGELIDEGHIVRRAPC
jgi:hypothetical protein